MTVMAKTGASGCGCGGGCAGGCSTGAGCGTTSTARCPEGAMARPRFFSGQLLTQEDLQLVVDYVVGKNRLRNRFLFGEGVVSGLNVTCPPCGTGTVIVAPGYALDCCGNDIHVPCPVELDVNALVRELRLKQLDGWDCGDPCKTQRCDDAQDGEGGDKGDAGKGKAQQDDKEDGRHYCLYLRYRELLADPVAPYLGDGTCAGVNCEPTRVCESFSFELRCTKKPAAADLLARIKACIGDLPTITKIASLAHVNAARALEVRRAAALVTSANVRVSPADLASIEAATQRLKSAKLKEEGATADDAQLRRHLADYQLLATSVARAGKTEGGNKRAPEALKEARSVLKEMQEPLSAMAGKLSEPTARDAASELFSLTARHALATPAAASESAEAKLFRAGAPYSLKQLLQQRDDATRIKQWLLERLERAGAATSCELRDRLLAVRIGDSDDLDVASAASSALASEELSLIFVEYLRDCICMALNPEAAPCEDAGVLLACVEMRACKVSRICNMSRRFVLSPANLRYWLPPIGMLGQLVDYFCCQLELRRAPIEDPQYYGEEKPLLAAERSFFLTSSRPEVELPDSLAPELAVPAAALGLSLTDVKQVSELALHLGALGVGSLRNAPRRRS
jgi:hypothetical protein